MSITNHNHDKGQSSKEDEHLFNVIGNYGPWQRDIFIIFFFVNIIGVWQNLAVTFLAPNPEFKCVSVDLNGINISEVQTKNGNFSLADFANDTTDQCKFEIPIISNANKSETKKKTVFCTQWDYDRSFYPETIVSEWDLVCDREWLVSLAKSIYMFGFLVSVLFFGQFSDSFGRFPTIIVCWVIACSAGILSAFSTSYLMFMILRFLMAFGRTGLTTTGYVIIMEIIGPKWRTEFGIAIQLGWSMGFVTLPAVAWFCRHWVHLQLALGIPTIPFICVYWLVPESPRWLMTQRKRKEFEAVILKATKKNGRELKEDVENILPFPQTESEKPKKRITPFDLVRTPRMRVRMISMTILWVTNAFVYYSLSYNTNDLGGNPYINFCLSGVVEIISYIFVYVSIKKYGRKMPTLIGMIIAGVACAAVIPVPEDMLWLNITLSMIGKLCITGTFGILYLYTTELFPTVIRNLSVGTCSTFGRVGSIVAPFIRELGKATDEWVPHAVNGAVAIGSAFLLLFLPETKDKKIPDTLEDGENFDNFEDLKTSQGTFSTENNKTEKSQL